MESVECLVVGGGVIGLAVARALARAGREVIVVESESGIGAGVSSRNSEVIHSGIYYRTGLDKTRLCVDGKAMLYAFCQEFGVPHKRCGKLLVAVNAEEVDKLTAIKAQAEANGVTDLIWLNSKEARALEPVLVAERVLLSPSTGIIDSHAFMLALRGDAEAHRSRRTHQWTRARHRSWRPRAHAPRRWFGRKRRGSQCAGARAVDRWHASR
jgi:L-2-hydroxyglutarate oxidase LhgO